MADDKDKGGGGADWISRVPHPAEPVIVLLIIATIGGAIINRVQNFFYNNPSLTGASETFLEKFLALAPLLKLISILISVFLGVILVYLSRKINHLKQEERVKLYPAEETLDDDNVVNPIVNKKWQKVEEHASSQNPNEWRLAIIEADIMLDELLNALGYRGDSIGEKLKTIEKSDFLTLDFAWEAHKVRNAIAHEGSSFNLNDREIRRVIDLYRAVFQEFKFI